jgi:hypothetical protein
MEPVKPIQTRYQIQELVVKWSKLFGYMSSISLLQLAKDGKFSLYVGNIGLRQCNLFTMPGLGGFRGKIVAYLNSEYIKLRDYQIHSLLAGEELTIIMLDIKELRESDFMQGDEPFDLSIIEAAVIDEKERIVIRPDDIKYLSVTSEAVSAFEQELMGELIKQQSVFGKKNSDSDSDSGQRRRDKQIEKICQTAKDLDYLDLLNIPEGGKAAIKAECLKNTRLFSEDSFLKAWKVANKRGLISMKDKEKYLSNQ